MVHKVVSADGTPIACWRSGAGPPLVLVHGAAADHARWAPVLPALEERCTVIAIDRRGRGESGDAAGYAIEREYEDVAAVAEWAGPGTCLLGHSYGGVCALEAALLSGAVARLILYEPSMGKVSPPAELIERLEAFLAAGDRDGLLRYFMREVAGAPPEQIEAMSAQPAWTARMAAAHTIPRELRADAGLRFDPSRFRGLDVPTMLLQGGESRDAFKEGVAVAHAAVPGSQVVVLPGQRHTAMDTATDLFTAEVLSFLGSRGA
jgi:pimeloyl-ACP methyl ester carboxylesterase